MCETDKSSENYQNLLLKLPIEYANEYHYLIQWSAVYVILSHNTRKSRGHVDSLKTSHFVKQIEIETNCFYYELAKVCTFKEFHEHWLYIHTIKISQISEFQNQLPNKFYLPISI